MNYKNGTFGITKISSKQSKRTLTVCIEPIRGEYSTMVSKRTWIVEIPVAASYKNVIVNNKKIDNVHFDKTKGLIRFEFDANTKDEQKIKITNYKSTY
jgi:hypothetical protein